MRSRAMLAAGVLLSAGFGWDEITGLRDSGAIGV